MAAKKRPGRKVPKTGVGLPLNQTGTPNGVGKMIGTVKPKKKPKHVKVKRY